ncbi:thymidylate synthase [Desulfovibrio aminophilus]|uniref:thymidylate synthase n=1 Tax=Desulfovibrio aminophilus TaxID=81425 RepID=UPI003396264A
MGYFSANTADEAWGLAYEMLITNSDHGQESRLGLTREILHANFHINNPRERWILSRQPALNPAFAIAEVFWILSGDNNSSFINYWNPILPRFAGNGPTYHGAYGFRIRKHFSIDQLERAYLALKNNPDSRQVIIQIWDSKVDFPTTDGKPVDDDIPCNICCMPKIRDGKLEWLQIMRSNDLYRGTPHNFIQFTSIQEILAGWLSLDLGSYHQISDSLHIYERDVSSVSHSKGNYPKNNDNLSIPKTDFDLHLNFIITALNKLSSQSLTKKQFSEIINTTSLDTSYNNLLLVCAADSARRRRWENEMQQSISNCGNGLLREAFNRWMLRNLKK